MRKELVKQRNLIVEIVQKSGWPGHLSSAMSILEIINILFNNVMVIDDTGLEGIKSDRLILSKGHAALALYVVLSEKGYIQERDLFEFNKRDCILGSHPCRHKVPSVDVSTGSLGHGLPIGVGMAYAYSLNNANNVVYVILGDGEMNEGAIWEAMLIASTKMNINICIIIDNNGIDEKGSNSTPLLKEKIEGFGWKAFECDGHDEDALKFNLMNARQGLNAIIANTIKGKGFSTMENDPETWHYRSVSKEERESLAKELL